jgi:hypothetical protein
VEILQNSKAIIFHNFPRIYSAGFSLRLSVACPKKCDVIGVDVKSVKSYILQLANFHLIKDAGSLVCRDAEDQVYKIVRDFVQEN